MGFLRAIRRLVDSIDAAFAILAAVVIVVAIGSGHIPTGAELWLYGIGGFFLLALIAFLVWDRLTRHGKQK